ncbi:TIGR03986 family CRISPR-associated RAMP protein [Fusobacterium polymorphum]|uniref:TIGR03986 family type III CRISPR-associated RAMP protein n=1 Tax=Fusobacterium nucleatum subsp. polymorphum TaxID=76857 RepID=UPI00300A1147
MAEKMTKGQKRDIVEDINEKDGTFKFKNENEYRKIIKRFKNDIHIGSDIKYKINGSNLEILDIDNSKYNHYQNKSTENNSFTNKNSEKKKDDTENKKYIDENRELDLEKDYYPYNFVSLGDPSKTEKHEVNKGNFSGIIKCSLKNLTPLFIGGNEENNRTCTLITEVEECCKTPERKEYRKAIKYIIPASTIKGELRNIIEVLTRSCMKNVENERLTYRYKMKKNGRTNIFGIIHKFPTEKELGKIIKADKIKVKKSILPDKYQEAGFYPLKVDIKSIFVQEWIKKAQKITKYNKGEDDPNAINDFSNFKKLQSDIAGENAILWVSSKIDNKIYEKILIFDEEACNNYYSFTKDEFDDLNFLIKERRKREEKENSCFYINEVKENSENTSSLNTLKKGDAIIFEGENKNAIRLAFSEIPRLRYKCSPLDLIPDNFRPCSNIDELCFACRLFGTIGDNTNSKNDNDKSKNELFAISSRIFITDALSLDERDKNKEKLLDRLRSLGEPHPTLLRFYLKYGDYNERYNKGKYEIRGRKFYWHHTKKIEVGKNWEKYKKSIETKNHDNTNSKIYFLEPLQEFNFEINFKDLNEEELGILLYSIEIEEGKSLHKLGKAKAYGFGSCEIKIDKCLIETGNKYTSFDKNDSFKEYSKKEYTEEFIKKAKDKYSLDSDEREEIKELKYILNRNNILNFSNDKSSFPEIEKKGETNTLNWFMNNKNYNLPTISDYIKEDEKRKGKK